MTNYYQTKNVAKTIYHRLQQNYPPATIQLIKEDDGSYENITSGTGFVIINDEAGTQISSGSAIAITDGPTGKAQYNWGVNDFTAIGNYVMKWVIDPNGQGKYVYLPEGDMEYQIIVS